VLQACTVAPVETEVADFFACSNFPADYPSSRLSGIVPVFGEVILGIALWLRSQFVYLIYWISSLPLIFFGDRELLLYTTRYEVYQVAKKTVG
jgi:hypothetical protein